MRSHQEVVQLMVDRFAADIFDCDEEADVDRLLTFQRATFGRDARQSKPRFTHWAYMRQQGSRLSYCERNGDVVGQQGQLQTALHIGEHDIPAVWATDLMVRDDWKMKGLGVALIGKILRENHVVMAVGVSEEARTMFDKQGWIILGRIDAFLKPLTPKGFRRSNASPSLKNTLFSQTLHGIFRPLDWMLTGIARLTSRGARIVPVKRIDESFEPLLQRRRERSKVSCDRSAEFLNWRFVDSPVAHRYKCYALWVGEHMRAFVVLRLATRFGKAVMYIDELIADKEVLPKMIGFIVEKSYRKGVDAIYYEGLGERVSSAFRKWAFVPRDNGHYFVVHTQDKALDGVLGERRNWSLTIADSDMGFRHDR